MSDAQAPLARIPLIDGRELVITPEAARVGERVNLIAQIEEARLLFLKPETIGLRMRDAGLLEYTVAQSGDGRRALDAIYRARPELNRPDLEPPAAEAPAGFQAPLPPAPEPQPLAPTAAPQGYMPGVPRNYQTSAYPPPPGLGRPGYPPLGYNPAFFPPAPVPPAPFPETVVDAYGSQPNERYATVTPQPRTAGQLIMATFQLIAQRFNLFAVIALLLVLLPQLVLGALSLVVLAIEGQDPFGAAPSLMTQFQQALNGQTTGATTTASTPNDNTAALLSFFILAGTLAFTAWGTAALTVAGREAALGRPTTPLACIREGASRLRSTLWALIRIDLALAVIAVPGLAIALSLILATVLPTPKGETPLPAGEGPVLMVMGVVVGIVTLAILTWLWPRIALLQPAAALGFPATFRNAWRLSAGAGWRLLIALVAVGGIAAVLTTAGSATQFLSNGWSTLVWVPVTQLIAAPLSALIHTVMFYDQRLRVEGYRLFQGEAITPPNATQEPQHDVVG